MPHLLLSLAIGLFLWEDNLFLNNTLGTLYVYANEGYKMKVHIAQGPLTCSYLGYSLKVLNGKNIARLCKQMKELFLICLHLCTKLNFATVFMYASEVRLWNGSIVSFVNY